MLTEKQISEIRGHLENAQNPVFFFDNDADGLCSFLLLRRFIGRGKGVAVKSFPDLNESYFRKVQELNADYIFVLDKPVISEGFFKNVEQNNIPLVWIDHHEILENKIPDFVFYFNPCLNEDRKNEPTTFLCHQVTRDKKDSWITVVGCIADSFVPDLYSEFEQENKELCIKSNNAFDVLYKSPLGKICKIFSFALKDRTTNVLNMLRYLIEVRSPYDILEENKKNSTMHYRFKQINVRYQKLLEKARAISDARKLLFFQYGGDLSISSDLSNELIYLFPKKIVVVVYISGTKANISVRGKNVKNLVLKSIAEFENATGGGHNDAVGAKINVEDLEKFRENLNNLLK